MKRDAYFHDVLLIANPAAAGGRTATRIRDVRAALESRFPSSVNIHVTSGPGDAHDRAAFCDGEDHPKFFVVLGGDGTIQEVANGLMERPVRSRRRSTLGILSSGTGQGLAQSIGLPTDLRAQVDVLSRMHTRELDLGVVRIQRPDGAIDRRYFVNECQMGIGGEVVRRVEGASFKRFNGRMTFGLTALYVAATLPNQFVHVEIDRSIHRSFHMLGLVVGNGAFTGGGMNLAAGAVPWDGRLDLLIMKAQSYSRRVTNLARIYSARHIRQPEFELLRIRHLSVNSSETVPAEADGEFLGHVPLTIDVVPHAIRIVTTGDIP